MADPVMAVYAALVEADWLPPKRNGTVDDLRAALRDAGLLLPDAQTEPKAEDVAVVTVIDRLAQVRATLRRIMEIPTPAGNAYADQVWDAIPSEPEAAGTRGGAVSDPDVEHAKQVRRRLKGGQAALSGLRLVLDERSIPCSHCDGDGCTECLGVGWVIPGVSAQQPEEEKGD
jgi:hypothetical protein